MCVCREVFFKGKAMYRVASKGREDVEQKMNCSWLLMKEDRVHFAASKALSARAKTEEFAPKRLRCG